MFGLLKYFEKFLNDLDENEFSVNKIQVQPLSIEKSKRQLFSHYRFEK